MNFCDSIKNIANVIILWRIRKLTLEGKITIFKSLAISKIVYLALLTTAPNSVIEELKQIQKMFLCGNKKPRNKHDTLCNQFKDGDFKNVHTVYKAFSLKCSWVKRLCNENFREWKLIPLHCIKKYLGKEFKFHSNVKFPNNILDSFPLFHKKFLGCWGKYYYQAPTVPWFTIFGIWFTILVV